MDFAEYDVIAALDRFHSATDRFPPHWPLAEDVRALAKAAKDLHENAMRLEGLIHVIEHLRAGWLTTDDDLRCRLLTTDERRAINFALPTDEELRQLIPSWVAEQEKMLEEEYEEYHYGGPDSQETPRLYFPGAPPGGYELHECPCCE